MSLFLFRQARLRRRHKREKWRILLDWQGLAARKRVALIRYSIQEWKTARDSMRTLAHSHTRKSSYWRSKWAGALRRADALEQVCMEARQALGVYTVGADAQTAASRVPCDSLTSEQEEKEEEEKEEEEKREEEEAEEAVVRTEEETEERRAERTMDHSVRGFDAQRAIQRLHSTQRRLEGMFGNEV